jgi:hypothetical protein
MVRGASKEIENAKARSDAHDVCFHPGLWPGMPSHVSTSYIPSRPSDLPSPMMLRMSLFVTVADTFEDDVAGRGERANAAVEVTLHAGVEQCAML